MTEIYLVRHGETANNGNGNINGSRYDQPLNERGRAQAAALAEYFKTHPVTRVFSSNLSRAADTARIAAGEPVIVNDLRELNFGDWEGTPSATLSERYPRELYLWVHDSVNAVFPNGDSVREATARFLRAFLDVLNKSRGERVAIFSHEAMLVSLLMQLLGIPLSGLCRMGGIANAAFARLLIDDDGGFTLTDYSYEAHLPPELLHNVDFNASFDVRTVLGRHQCDLLRV